MTTNKTIITSALDAVNKDIMDELIESAKPLIARIDSIRLGVSEYEKQIVDKYKELVTLASSKVDDSFLASVPAGASKDTVTSVIKKMNDDRQAAVEIAAKNIWNQIDTLQSRVDSDKKKQDELVKQLTELKPRTVTVPNVAV